MARPRVPNLLSLACLALGFASLAAVGGQDWDSAVRLILLAAAADSWAGRRAIRRGHQSAMGLELDSLSSLLTFGVAPLVLLYARVLGSWEPWGWVACGGLAASCAFRLARDNPDRPEARFYRGLPVPVFGLGATLASGLLKDPRHLAALLVGLALLMVIRLPYRRLGVAGLSLVVAPLVALAALLPHRPAVLAAALSVCVAYALVGHTRIASTLLSGPSPFSARGGE